jgi:hypothetical protein
MFRVLRFLLLPLGYLAFLIALVTLSTAAWLLGEEHELGFFSGRLARTVWRYPEVTRRGVQVAWLTWGALFALSFSPLDPVTSSRWDEVALAALAALVVWSRFFAAHRAGR